MANSADLDLDCLQMQGISGFSTTRVKVSEVFKLILFVKYVGMFLQVLCILFVRGLYGLHVGSSLQTMCILSEGSMVWGVGGVFMYSLLSEVFVSKDFFRSFSFLFVFVVLQFVSDGFFRFSMFVRVLGVRRVLQVHCFLSVEVSRFKCQRISSDLVLRFGVWVSNDFKAYLIKSIKGCQRLRCLFLQVQSLFIRRGKTNVLWLRSEFVC